MRAILPVLGSSLILLIFLGCQRAEENIQRPSSVLTITKEPEMLYTYLCDDGYRFQVKLNPNHVVLMLPDEQLTLPQIPSGSGIKYGNELATFWTKDKEAIVEVKDTQHLNCKEAASTADHK